MNLIFTCGGTAGHINPAIAISYSQHGIQIGIGPNIHICRNQTILCAKQMIANFGYRILHWAVDRRAGTYDNGGYKRKDYSPHLISSSIW